MAGVGVGTMKAERTTSKEGWWTPIRLAGVLGVVFVASYLVVFFFLPGVVPELDAPAPVFLAYLTDNRALVLAHIVLGSLVFGVLLPAYAAALYRATAQQERSVWRLLVLSAAVLIMTVVVAGGGLLMLLGAYLAPDGLTGESARLLVSGDLLAFAVLVPWGFALFSLASAMALRAAGILNGWMAGAGLAVSALLVIGITWVFGDATGPIAYVSFLSIMLWAVWVLVASVLMIRATAREEHAGA